ncbi:BnaA01g05700D [Brassica napus]|uniref:BnaA01g05700D protein n=1 Tax=Brassica napus TaxID=3708 RepID=A0A078HZ52_BRANA|nr:BnaA01g05700D [Brassica napus]
MTKLSLVIKILTYDAVWEKLLLRPSLCHSDFQENRKKTKAAAAIKAIQERMEDKLKTEIEQKETEAKLALSEAEEMAKAELISAIAKEKILMIKALCMAFYARSEEARQSHSIHKLALGALALEDTLSKGLPIQNEIDMLQTYLEGIHQDSMLDLVLSSLPEEALSTGTDTVQQLNQKFNTLRGALRHFSLIPPGVKGSKAEEILNAWVRRARNRAITEQAVTLLQSYATCASLT